MRLYPQVSATAMLLGTETQGQCPHCVRGSGEPGSSARPGGWALTASFLVQGRGASKEVHECKGGGFFVGDFSGHALPWVLSRLLPTFHVRTWLCVCHSCLSLWSHSACFPGRLIISGAQRSRVNPCPVPGANLEFQSPTDNSSSS